MRDLPNFKLSEFRHSELVEQDAADFLQEVRTQYGAPLVVTSDARTTAENTAAGGSPTSWHVRGRAFDLRWPADDKLAWRLVDAVFAVAETCDRGISIELELVYSARDKHVHLAVKNDGTPSRLIVAAD
jgi:hypothetical protein